MTSAQELDELERKKASLQVQLLKARADYDQQAASIQAEADKLDDRMRQIRAAVTDANDLKQQIERRSNRPPPLLRK